MSEMKGQVVAQEINIENDIEISRGIFQSDIIMFFLSEEKNKSERFRKELSEAKKESKSILIFKLDDELMPINDINNFMFVRIEETLKEETIIRLNNILLNSLGSYKRMNHAAFSQIKATFVHKFNIEKYAIISNELVILHNYTGCHLKLFNFKTSTIVNEIKEQSRFLFCWIDHRKEFIIVGVRGFNSEIKVKFFDTNANGMATDEIKIYLPNHTFKYVLKSIAYNISNGNTIISYQYGNRAIGINNIVQFDRNFDLVRLEPEFNINSTGMPCEIKIFSKFIFTWSDTEYLSIYDLNFRFLISVHTGIITALFTCTTLSDYIFIETSNSIKLFNMINFNIENVFVKFQLKLKMIVNENFLFCDQNFNSIYFVQKLIFLKKRSSPHLIYNCDFSLFNSHVYSNPYLLPCGKSACLNCIYRNLNFSTGLIKCTNASCNIQEHRLSDICKRDMKMEQILKENCQKILHEMIRDGNESLVIKCMSISFSCKKVKSGSRSNRSTKSL